MPKTHVLAGAALMLAAATPAFAHHSFAMYEKEKKVVLNGELKEVRWQNPHIGFDVLGKDETGKVQQWKIEGPSPIEWRSKGWTKSDFTVGEKVTLKISPARDGTPVAGLVIFTNSKGKTFGFDVK
jgi:hypothetical protein